MAASAGTLMQHGLEPLGFHATHTLACGVGPGGAALQTRHALGIKSVHDIAHGLVAASHLARNSGHPGTVLAGQHDLAASYAKGFGGPESSLHLLALLWG